MSEHTPEPWFAEEYFDKNHDRFLFDIRAENEEIVGSEGLWTSESSDRANARRIVACVNACKGISTDRLEKMVPSTLANLLTLKGEK